MKNAIKYFLHFEEITMKLITVACNNYEICLHPPHLSESCHHDFHWAVKQAVPATFIDFVLFTHA